VPGVEQGFNVTGGQLQLEVVEKAFFAPRDGVEDVANKADS
jgi:hypothetical protein